MADLKFKTRAKISKAKLAIEHLPEHHAKAVQELCHDHAALAETNSRLWKDNVALRKQIAQLERAVPDE